MSLVPNGLIGQLKAEIERAKNVSYDRAYHMLQAELFHAIGALESIDHMTKDVNVKLEITKNVQAV